MVSELGPIIDFVPPPMFREITLALREYLSLVNFASAKWCAPVPPLLFRSISAAYECAGRSLGIDTFHYKWRLQVLIIPFLMFCVPWTLYVLERKANPTTAKINLTSNLFFVVFLCAFEAICCAVWRAH